MTPQTMKSFHKQLKILISASALPIAVASIFVGNSVSASPLNNINNSRFDNLKQLLQGIAQNNEEPPEVIIDGNSGSYPSPSSTSQNTDGATRFACEYINGEYTVMYYPESQPDRSYPWAIPSQMGNNWSPQKRCDTITSRFESYRQDGLLEMSTGFVNNHDVICVTTQVDPTDCRLLLTIPPGQDPQLTRNLIFENLIIADDGQQTRGVYTFGDSQSTKDALNEVGSILGAEGLGNRANNKSDEDIDLRPFLDPADGGTGAKLTGGRKIAPSNSNSSSSDRKPSIFK